MELGVEGKRALVTGASRGLGRSIALGLAREGAKVAIVSRTQSALETVCSEMGGVSAGHYGLVADLMTEHGPTRVLEDIGAHFGALDIVVHNLGGTMGIRDPFGPPEDWWTVWRFNLGVAIEMNRTIIPAMQAQRWGRVVHISSIAAERSRASIPYSTAKSALNAYVRGLGCSVAQDGVVVTAVMPGSIASSGGHWDILLSKNPERASEYLAERMAIGRFGAPEEISDFIVFLCSERASFFAGAAIPVDGGTW